MSYKNLFKNLRNTLDSIQASGTISSIIETIIDSLMAKPAIYDFGIIGARVYKRIDSFYELISKFGESGKVKIGYRIPIDYIGVKSVLRTGYFLMRPDDPGYSKKIESPLGLKAFAAIVLGDDDEYMICFSLEEPFDKEKVMNNLGL